MELDPIDPVGAFPLIATVGIYVLQHCHLSFFNHPQCQTGTMTITIHYFHE